VRNRLKRQVRDVLRRFPDRAGLSGLDVVVNVRDRAAGTDHAVLRADLERLLARVLRSGA
jgi:ribonuclease P protein component